MNTRLFVVPIVSGLLAIALVGCGSNARAPVEDRAARTPAATPPSHTKGARQYRVQDGDTLYSIAFRYGLDFRKVAAANRIPSPYTIYPGQQITLREAALELAARPADSKPARPVGKSVKPARPVDTPSPSAAKTRQQPGPSKASTPPKKADYSGAAVSRWRWPAAGKVTRGYSGSVHKGIDIAGKRGDAIVAVAPGKVVYAGAGIVGFGELLIVKHNEVYLSAYGHNDRLLVAEGEVVKAGQKIAEKGSSGTDTVKLHFEIRKEGKPIDPQRVLPKR